MISFFKKNKNNLNEGSSDSADGLAITVFDRWKKVAETSPQYLPLEENFSSKNEKYIWSLLNLRFIHLMMVVKGFVTETFDERITPKINEHKDELNNQYKSKVVKDRYGVLSDNGWLDERQYFMITVLKSDTDNLISDICQEVATFEKIIVDDNSLKRSIKRDYNEHEFSVNFVETSLKKECDTLFINWIKNDSSEVLEEFVGNKVLELCFQRIHQIIEDPELKKRSIHDKDYQGDDRNNSEVDDVANVSPYDYEELCAKILRDSGWEASATRKSGDQGADVYAEKNGLSVVLQCKLTNSAVGNKAVQEIISGQKYMSSDFAAVVTPAKYTPGAQDLARTAKVLLLHHEDLPHLETLCKHLS
ncbi:restriction endonuclease [Acidithiobacillus ferrooxidans]|uniref:restriction endonuclease n=1 Tax=Acidithiobacillus ferrooxidans TaxID=920 RepID=UPI001C06BEAD|nr:restriction endonuclease [Acidithiobacillus ferrooxidans]MBU2857286.1 restriction endonuclease [Acidithiobacillus ferrooxidans]